MEYAVAGFTSTWDTETTHPDIASYLQPRPVRLRLRDGRALEGKIHVPEGQSAMGFLRLRRSFLNLTAVRWLGPGAPDEELPHLGVRLSRILWLVPLDPTLPLQSAARPPDATREIELRIEGGLVLQVRIALAEEQRMSDFFDARPGFIALRSVRIGSATDVVDRLVVNGDAIITIRELG